MEKTGKCYIAEFLKSGFFIAAIMLAGIFLSAMITLNEFKIIGALIADKSILTAIIIVFVYYAVIVVVSAIKNKTKGRISLYDSFFWACLGTGFVYALYAFIILKRPSAAHLGVAACFIILGILFIVFSAIKYKGENTDETKPAKSGKMAEYYRAVTERTPSFIIIVLSALFTCCAYLAIFNLHSFGFDTAMYVVVALCAIPVLLFLIIGASDKPIGIFDAALLAMAITVPALFVFSACGEFSASRSVLYYAFSAAFALIVIFYSVFRWICSDTKEKPPVQIPEKTCKVCRYFNKFSRKFNLLFALACGSVLTLITLVFFRYTSFGIYFDALTEGNAEGVGTILIILISAVSFVILILSGIITFINVKAPIVTIGDFTLFVCLSYSVFGLLSFINIFSRIGCVILILVFLFCLTVFAVRVKHVVYDN